MPFQDIKDLLQASFKGIPFLYVSSSESSGRKNVFYEYPNTDKRGFSDLGLNLESFTIRCYTVGDTKSDYKQNRDRLKSALRSKGSGILVHPELGQLNCAVDGYTLDTSIEHLNRADFSINFRVVSDPIKPAETQNNIPKIENIAVDTIDKVSDDIEENYNVSSNNFTNFETAKNKALSISNKIIDIANKVEQRADIFNEFISTINDFEDKINSIVSSPSRYSTEFKNIFDNLRLIATDPIERFLMFTKLFSFGSNDTNIGTDTIFKIERNKNNDVINNAVNSNSLAYAYATLKEIDFNNQEEFNRFNELLNEQWEYLQGQELNFDVRENLLDLRGEADKYIDTLNLPELVTVETIETSPTLLSYQYYGSTDRDDEISKLNSLKDYGIILGNVTLQGDFQ